MANPELASQLNVAETLDSLLTPGRNLWISKDSDGEYSATITRPNVSTGPVSTLEGVLDELTPNPRRKLCLHCKANKPLWRFGPDSDSKDGHAGVCKECETKRILERARQRKKKKDISSVVDGDVAQ